MYDRLLQPLKIGGIMGKNRTFSSPTPLAAPNPDPAPPPTLGAPPVAVPGPLHIPYSVPDRPKNTVPWPEPCKTLNDNTHTSLVVKKDCCEL